MPFAALLLGLIGLIPFIGCGLAAIGPQTGASDPWLTALIGYAAVVLSFVGGVHWGLVLRESEPRMRGARIALAVVPLLFGWAALAAATTAYWIALLILIAGYILAIAAEQQGSRQGMLPQRYLWLRWTFTIVAVAMLTTVVTLRLLGQTIVF